MISMLLATEEASLVDEATSAWTVWNAAATRLTPTV